MKSRAVFLGIGCFALIAVVLAVVSYATRGMSGPPRHGRVLFGPEGELAFDLRVDGQQLTLIEQGGTSSQTYRFSKDGIVETSGIEFQSPESSSIYTIDSITRIIENGDFPRHSLVIDVSVADGSTQFEQYCDLHLRELAETPAIAHFDGPLTVELQTIYWKLPSSTRLVTGDSPVDLRVNIGTINEQSACWTVVKSHKGDDPKFPDGVFPIARVTYGAGEGTNSESGEFEQTYPLDAFC